MKSVNKVILLGHLGKDPELKYTQQQGTPVAKLSLATNERYKDKSGQWEDRTNWHTIVLWKYLAEFAGEHLKKGSQVYIEGKLENRTWDDQHTGQKRYAVDIVAHDLIMLGDSHLTPKRTAEKPVAQTAGSAITPSNPITNEDIPF